MRLCWAADVDGYKDSVFCERLRKVYKEISDLISNMISDLIFGVDNDA